MGCSCHFALNLTFISSGGSVDGVGCCDWVAGRCSSFPQDWGAGVRGSSLRTFADVDEGEGMGMGGGVRMAEAGKEMGEVKGG